MRYIALWLVGICILVFILQNIFPTITDYFALNSAVALSQPWLFVTHLFLHADVLHILYNMFALALFGIIFENIIGSKKFIIIYFVSGFIAGIGSVIFYPASIGASGAIFGIMGCLAALRPRMTVWVGSVPMPMIIAAVVWAGLDLLGMFAPSGIANAAHLFGLFFGIGVGILLRKKFGEPLFIKREKIFDEDISVWERKYMK